MLSMNHEEAKFVTTDGYEAIVCAYPAGHRCGYIVVPPTHPCYQKPYSEILIDVHGGLTFSDTIDNQWVIGFDCSHLGDRKDESIMDDTHRAFYSTNYLDQLNEGVVRTLEFCIEECESMGKQLASMVDYVERSAFHKAEQATQVIKPDTISESSSADSITEKEKATKDGEPYISVLSVDFDPNDVNQGAFELDWNEIFVARLIKAGYRGSNDVDIVEQWFNEVCRNVVLETFEQDQANVLPIDENGMRPYE